MLPLTAIESVHRCVQLRTCQTSACLSRLSRPALVGALASQVSISVSARSYAWLARIRRHIPDAAKVMYSNFLDQAVLDNGRSWLNLDRDQGPTKAHFVMRLSGSLRSCPPYPQSAFSRKGCIRAGSTPGRLEVSCSELRSVLAVPS